MENTLVMTEILGGKKILGKAVSSRTALDALLRKGLPYGTVEAVVRNLSMGLPDIISLLASSSRTMARRKKEGHLSVTESDRLARLARVYSAAETVFGSPENAKRWMNKPNRALGGLTPIKALETDIGAAEVVNVLGRIEYGVYS